MIGGVAGHEFGTEKGRLARAWTNIAVAGRHSTWIVGEAAMGAVHKDFGAGHVPRETQRKLESLTEEYDIWVGMVVTSERRPSCRMCLRSRQHFIFTYAQITQCGYIPADVYPLVVPGVL